MPIKGVARALTGIAAVAALALEMAAAAPAGPPKLTGSQIIAKALDLREGINDFSARFAIHTDIEGLDIPDSSGTVYFKRPDKLKVEPDRGLVVLPKDAVMLTRISTAIKAGADITIVGQRETPGGIVYGLKIVPKQDKEGIRLMAWVNGKDWTMQKMEVWRGTTRTMSIAWEHTLVQERFWLPRSVSCDVAHRPRRGQPRMEGTASITLSQYRVNTGLPDTLFPEPEPDR